MGYTYKPCNCGSGEIWQPVEDARGIFVSYVCSQCEEKKLGGYRKEIFENPNYQTDEFVEVD
jgi:NADH:ubiquinone oxidoreductase subunit D